MHLYTGSSIDFISDATRNRIASKLEESFLRHFRYKPPQAEVHSWQNSLRAMANVLETGGINDHGVVVELQLPLSSKRLDCMITGHDESRHAGAVIVELKQWEKAGPSPIDDCVTSFIGGGERDRLHPSCQVGNYQRYLADVHTAFSGGEIALGACSYLHNMDSSDASEVRADRFSDLLTLYPLFNDGRGFLGGQPLEVLGELGHFDRERHREVLRVMETLPLPLSCEATELRLDAFDVVKNTYRVLLTRGLRGCYVYFQDEPTRDFGLSRIGG